VRADRKEVSVNYCAIVTINHCKYEEESNFEFPETREYHEVLNFLRAPFV